MKVNATGVFADKMLKMDDPNARSIVAPSQGIHIIIDKKFLPGDTAVMVPHTDDGRVLWYNPPDSLRLPVENGRRTGKWQRKW